MKPQMMDACQPTSRPIQIQSKPRSMALMIMAIRPKVHASSCKRKESQVRRILRGGFLFCHVLSPVSGLQSSCSVPTPWRGTPATRRRRRPLTSSVRGGRRSLPHVPSRLQACPGWSIQAQGDINGGVVGPGDLGELPPRAVKRDVTLAHLDLHVVGFRRPSQQGICNRPQLGVAGVLAVDESWGRR